MKDSSSILEKVRRLIESDSSPTIMSQNLICIDLCESIILKEISPLALDFSKRCLNVKLQKRPSIDELMFHPFLKWWNLNELIKKIFLKDQCIKFIYSFCLYFSNELFIVFIFFCLLDFAYFIWWSCSSFDPFYAFLHHINQKWNL